MATASRPLGGSAGDVFSYLSGETDDGCARGVNFDYYGFQGEAWGRGAERLGITSLDREQFINLADGFSLDGSTRHIQTNNGTHVSGIDVMVSAPKSASVLLIRATPAERVAIHREWRAAVRVAFDRMERHARVARVTVSKPSEGPTEATPTKRQGSETERVPADLIAYVAHHQTARPTAETEARGAPPDPHMHSHLFLINQAFIPDANHPAGGKWRAIDDYGIKKQAEAREALLQAEFGRRLEDLGYRLSWSRDKRGYDRWEIDGIDRPTIRHFSSNARRAEKVARDFERQHFRPPEPHELRDRMRTSRRAKDQAHDHSPSWHELDDSAGHAGIQVPHIAPGAPIQRPALECREKELSRSSFSRHSRAGRWIGAPGAMWGT